MTVLIVTHGKDNHSVEMVSQAIEARGGRAFRFNTEQFPTSAQLVLGYGHGLGQQSVRTEAGEVALADIEAVWYRRVRLGAAIPGDMDPQLRAPSIEETSRTFYGMLASLDCFVLDPLHLIRRAERKQLQLKLAREVGLEVPDTLITNDPDAVRAFARAHSDGIITKMQASFAVYRGDEEQVVFTNPVDEAALSDLDGLSFCPMTFQENIPKQLEFRVTVVGRSIFCAAIDSNRTTGAEHDWRRHGAELATAWTAHELPGEVRNRILDLMDALLLNYGAMDIILTPDGRYVFLEVNPCGEFFWLDSYAGLPIAEEIAAVLTGQARRRENSLLAGFC